MTPRILALGLFALCISARAVDLIPVEDFAKLPAFTDIKLSPDGEFVGYVREHEGVKRMCVTELATMKMTAFQLGEGMVMPGDLGVTEFDWIGPHRLVIQTTMNDLYNGGWIALDRDRANVKPLSGDIARRNFLTEITDFFPSEILYRFEDDRTILVTNNRIDIGHREAQYPEVVKLDTRTGIGTTVLKNPGHVIRWAADQQGHIRMGISVQDGKASILYRENDSAEWQTTSTLEMDADIRPIGFTHDGQAVYVRVRSRHHTWALYLYNLRTRELGEPIWENKEYDFDSVVRDPLTREVVGVRYMAEGPRTDWLNAKYKGIQAAVDAILPGTVNVISNFTRDGKRMLVNSFSDRAPEVAYVYDTERGEVRSIGGSRKWIKPEQMAQMHPMVYKARDGLDIHACLTIPVGRKPFNLPLVVMPHGGPIGIRDHWGFDPLVQMLANRGYAVLQMDYRGSGGYGHRFVRAGRKEVGGKIQDDIEDAARWAISKKVADPKRIAIVGGSFGGYSALFALGKTPDLYCCGVSIAGVTDWLSIFKEIDPEFDLAREYWKRNFGDPEQDEARLRAISPVNFADKITAPVLIVQGKNDRRVPPRQANKMIAALEKAGHQPESLFIPDEGHGFLHDKARIAEFKAIEAFLAKHLGPGSTALATDKSASATNAPAVTQPGAK
ncbi:MAG: S9 family peptidase [Nibricoccus sp.]